MDPLEGWSEEPSSLHKYNYANSDPIDGSDPKGTDTLVETIGVLNISSVVRGLSVVSALVLACSVESALGFGPCGANNRQKEGRMRVQLQLGNTFTVPGTPVLTNSDPPGVTILQVRNQGLAPLYLIAKSEASRFPFNRFEFDFFTAVIEISQQAETFAPFGWTGFRRSLLSAPIGDSGWRIDVDNLEGTNLRQ